MAMLVTFFFVALVHAPYLATNETDGAAHYLHTALNYRGGNCKPWPLMGIFLLVPPVIRHTIYDWIGRRRYQWYGKKECCWIPDEDIKSRFLS